MCKQLAMFGQTCASKCFPGYYAQMNAMRTDVVCFGWKMIQAKCDEDMRED